MSNIRWVISALLLYHFTALISHALPPPDTLPTPATIRPGRPQDPFLVRTLTPLLDRAALTVAQAEPGLFAATAPLRAVTQPYISAGLRQYWAMFASPEHRAQYIRLDYYVAGGAGAPVSVMRELVYPTGRGDRVRIGTEFLDKASQGAFVSFRAMQAAGARRRAPTDLVPMVRYFRSRFEERALSPEESVARVALWYGAAPLPPPGESLDTLPRETVLERYYGGPFGVPSAQAPPREGSEEREADILWTLEFIDTP